MRLLTALLTLACSIGYCTDTWSPVPPAVITGGTASLGGVISAPLSGNRFIATWAQGADEEFSSVLPYYAIYDEGSSSWSTPATQIPLTAASDQYVYVTSGGGVALVTWVDKSGGGDNLRPFYSVYTISSNTWSTPAPIPSSLTATSDSVVVSSFGNNRFLTTWVNASDASPYYAVFNLTGPSWTTPAQLDTAIISFIVPAYNPLTNQFIATWRGATPVNYILFDNTGAPTSPVSTIPSSATADSWIVPAYDPTSNQFIVTWVDAGFPTYVRSTALSPTAATWNTPSAISPVAAIPNTPVFLSANLSTGDILFSWVIFSMTDILPYYSVYNSGVFSAAQQIPSSSPVASALFSSCDSGTGKFLVTWLNFLSDSPDFNGPPFYSTLLHTNSPVLSTTTTVTANPNPSMQTQVVTIKARVTASDSTIPTGYVIFKVKGRRIGSAMLNHNGVAFLKTQCLPVGTSTITAIYPGSGIYPASSGTVSHTVL